MRFPQCIVCLSPKTFAIFDDTQTIRPDLHPADYCQHFRLNSEEIESGNDHRRKRHWPKLRKESANIGRAVRAPAKYTAPSTLHGTWVVHHAICTRRVPNKTKQKK